MGAGDLNCDTMQAFYVEGGDLNCGSLVCVTNTLYTEPSLSEQKRGKGCFVLLFHSLIIPIRAQSLIYLASI